VSRRRPRPAPRSLVPVGAVLMALAFGAPAVGQGLGSAAAHEKERRQRTKTPPARVLTNDDLPSSSDPGDTDAASGVVDDEETTPSSDPALEPVDPVRAELDREREERALSERDWRTRFAEARAHVAEAEARCWQDVVRTEFRSGIPVQVRIKEFVETEEYRQAKRALADLREEFRRTGLPAGWARE
jgi:hypothetical protein